MAFPKALPALRKRIFEIIEIGAPEDYASRAYAILNILSIVVNLTASILYTFDEFSVPYGSVLLSIEAVTVAFFALDFFLRIITAKCLYPKLGEIRALSKYLLSFSGLVEDPRSGYLPPDDHHHDQAQGQDAHPEGRSGHAGGRQGHHVYADARQPRTEYRNLRSGSLSLWMGGFFLLFAYIAPK